MSNNDVSLARQNFSEASEAAINRQINAELTASYVYQSISSWLARDTVALLNLSKYYHKMSMEEREHAQKLVDYMSKRGGRVKWEPIAAPPAEWKSAMNILESALKLERDVNQSLLNLHKVAGDSGDAALCDFIESEFLEDQVEDIKKAADLVTQLQRCGGEGLGLFIFDKEFQE